MGCGSSSTQVTHIKKADEKRTSEILNNDESHFNHKDVRKDSASSKGKSKSSSSSVSSLRDRRESGKSDRSEKSDRLGSGKSDKSKRSDRLGSGKSDRSKHSKPDRIGSGRSDRYLSEHESYEKETHVETANVTTGDSQPIENKADNFTDVSTTTFTDKYQDDLNADVECKHDFKHEDKEEKIDEYDEYSHLDLNPIVIPETDSNRQMANYTIDDVVNNNTEKGANNWFLYGRKVYSLDKFSPIVFNRIQQYLELTDQEYKSAKNLLSGKAGNFPVLIARSYGVERKEMELILPACQIGNLINMTREDYLSRLKHCVENVKTELEAEEKLTENLVDYLEQLSRWLSNYPNVELEMPIDRTNVDPNECEFPLPDKIRADSTVLRHWAKNWDEFDMTVDENGAWHIVPLLNEDWGDVHQTFVDIVSSSRDESLPDLDMEIEGEAAWRVIELEIVKNDRTTEEQDEIWKAREARKDLHDPERMKRRRKQIADNFLKRHDTRLNAEAMIPYTEWASRLEQHWKEFQELCENYVHRRQTSQEPEKIADAKDLEPKALPDNIPPQDTMSLLSDHGTS